MKNKISQIAFVLLVLIISSCSKDEVAPEITPVLTAEFSVNYDSDLQNTLYPSMIFGLTEIEKQLNEPFDYFTINIKPNIKTGIRIIVEESKLNFETIITLNGIQSDTTIRPSLKWKYDDLKQLSQPGNIDLTFACYGDDNKEIGRQNLKLSYRSINECVLLTKSNSEVIPLYFLIAGYVNEDSPVIDPFLQEVLQNTNLSAFTGYQNGDLVVLEQIDAIFNTLRNKGVKYSSITNTSNTNTNIISQYIRFSDEVLNNTQANCADGTTFFCSVLKKIGIHTVMVFVPGHVYLGYYSDAAKTSLGLLETTAVGNQAMSFDDASNYQVDTFNSKLVELYNNDYLDGYFIIDVDNARQIIKPIGR